MWEDCVFCKSWDDDHLWEISDQHPLKENGSRETLKLLQENLDVKVQTDLQDTLLLKNIMIYGGNIYQSIIITRHPPILCLDQK